MYDLILGKQSLHDLGVILDFKEKTITIDEILLPMSVIGHGILAGTYLAEYRDSLK